MKLFWSDRSPYVRKVMLCAHELGLAAGIETVPAVVTLRDRNPAVVAVNPLGQIPALVRDDGEVLFDSSVICQYLIASAPDGPRLLPGAAEARLDTLRRERLGDGIMDGLIRWHSEQRRAPDPRGDATMAVCRHKLMEAAGWLEARVASREHPDLGEIAVASALSYADYRFQEADWRIGHPKLASWYAGFTRRPSFQATLFAGQTSG